MAAHPPEEPPSAPAEGQGTGEVPAGTLHGACVAIGGHGVLIRGPSGCGKSHLAFALILAGRAGILPETRLVADDRVLVEVVEGRLLARPAPALAGLLEVRGLGLRRLQPLAPVPLRLLVDLAATDAERLPPPGRTASFAGVALARLALGPGMDPVHAVIAYALTAPGLDDEAAGDTPWI
ncbi:HPr kinase/phosphorylase [Ancylobacter lacus]|uniref:HPr kinase/phosphorylase n=1 Tax=Ancylobacter lacus TaxID=2579970 RepID=UPI001BCF4DA8|nr:HPr kinase/phosphatase C-terminal domain-containing protein [Ancylobacter lacus]MBS7538783.1 HPr kinase/phosphatase C-terminal domain-containing protein [Ancylobacter lacus]